jgi:MATE family multidrug resistance protein
VSSSRAESLEEGSEGAEGSEGRLKRSVAHGADLVGTQSQKTTINDAAEGRPQTKSGAFFKRSGDLSFRTSQITKELVQLAWPIAAAMLGETAIGLVDTKLVGGLGAGALGGVGLAATFMFLTYSMSYGAMRGVKVRVAHAIGEGNPHHAFAYARGGLAMGAVFGVVVLLVCRDISPLLQWIGTDPALIPYAREFLGAVTLGAPATCAMAALIQHRQATGDSRTPMVVGITGNIFNAVMAWALIYGHLGLPGLGVRGAGYATATTEMLELAVMLSLFVRDERRARRAAAAEATTDVVESLGTPQPPRKCKPPHFWRAVRGVADLGIPTGFQFMAETLAFTAFTVVLGSISKEEIASHQIALNVIRVSFLPGVAVSEAASVLVGRALGRRRLDEADAAVRSALAIAVGFMAVCGVVFAIAGGLLGRFFSSDPLVVRGAQKLLFVAAVFQVLDAVNIVLRGALRGAKDVRVVAVIGVLVVWTFLPTAAYVLGKLCGLGALGGWLGFVGETTVGATLFWLRWKRGGWRKNYTPQ